MSILKNGSLRHIMAVVVVSVIVIATAVVTFPGQGVCDSEDTQGIASVATIPDTEPNPCRPGSEPTNPTEYVPPVLLQQESPQQGTEDSIPKIDEPKPVPKKESTEQVYSDSINKALKYMNVTPKHLDMWASKRPNSAIKKLGSLTFEEQRRVAYIACYIRKCNKRISIETVWREACAMFVGAQKYKISPELIAAIGRMESEYNPDCLSHRGACGVMQVMYKVHRARLARCRIAKTRNDMFDPELGVYAGIEVFRACSSGTTSLHKALMRYLGGHSDRYYRKIMKYENQIKLNGEKLGL